MKLALRIGIIAAATCVAAVIVWQGVTAHGSPEPTQPNTSPTVAFLDIGVLVFREGLECILVLAAITASMTGTKRAYRRPVGAGAGMAFVATLITWFIAVRIVNSLSDNIPALDLQAATGLLAVIVLLVMVGEQAQEMQLAHWIPTTEISSLKNYVPPWIGLWFAVFPTTETLVAQFIAALLVVGSYYAARHFGGGAPPESAEPVQEARVEARAAIVERLETVPAVSHR